MRDLVTLLADFHAARQHQLKLLKEIGSRVHAE